MEKRIRRIRAAVPTPSRGIRIPAAEQTKMDVLLQSIADIDMQVAHLAFTREEKVKELFMMMKTYKLDHLAVEEAEADIVTPKGKTVNRIDPHGFFDMVDEDDFFACIEVLKSRAEKVLSERELKKITESTPGKIGEPELKVKRR